MAIFEPPNPYWPPATLSIIDRPCGCSYGLACTCNNEAQVFVSEPEYVGRHREPEPSPDPCPVWVDMEWWTDLARYGSVEDPTFEMPR